MPTPAPDNPFARAHTIIIKLGSAVLTVPGSGALDLPVMHALCGTLVSRIRAGQRVILVTSAAVAAGRPLLKIPLAHRPTIAEKQALAAVGQSRLMQLYAEFFARHEVPVGQMLLSRDDMEDRRRYNNARYTLQELLQRGCLPIINENDTVTVDELRFGDNDGLAALVAVKMQAQALVLLSDVAGVFDADPRTNPAARLLAEIPEVTPAFIDEVSPDTPAGKGAVGSGGMRSKLLAAQAATAAGVNVAIADGKAPDMLESIFAGPFRGTHFLPSSRPINSRRQWILSGKCAGRRVLIDAGAAAALATAGKSLLPAGVRKVVGPFKPGDLIEVAAEDGSPLARGISNYSSDELARIAGRKSSEIEQVLGVRPYAEAIHRDNLALL